MVYWDWLIVRRQQLQAALSDQMAEAERFMDFILTPPLWRMPCLPARIGWHPSVADPTLLGVVMNVA
jgi:hypothetical protein